MIHLVTDQECWGTSQYTYMIREKRCAKYLTLTLLISSSNCSIYYTIVYSKRTQPSKWLMKSKKWVFKLSKFGPNGLALIYVKKTVGVNYQGT